MNPVVTHAQHRVPLERLLNGEVELGGQTDREVGITEVLAKPGRMAVVVLVFIAAVEFTPMTGVEPEVA